MSIGSWADGGIILRGRQGPVVAAWTVVARPWQIAVTDRRTGGNRPWPHIRMTARITGGQTIPHSSHKTFPENNFHNPIDIDHGQSDIHIHVPCIPLFDIVNRCHDAAHAARGINMEKTQMNITFNWGEESHNLNTNDEADLKALQYLVQYGANKSRQDAVAGWANAIAGKGESAWTAEEVSAYAKDNNVSANADAIMSHRMAERLAAILDGSIATRGPSGPRKVGRDKMLWNAAKAGLERYVQAALAAGRKITLPTKATELKPYIDKYLEKNRTAIEAEVDATIAMAARNDGDELADLLA